MSRTHALLLKTLCWIAVFALLACSVAYAIIVNRAYADATRRGLSGLWCGNTVTDPLALIFSFSTPAAAAAVIGLGALRLRHIVSTSSVVTALVITLACTGALVSFGTQLFRASLPGHHLSELVWWMGSWFPV